MEARALAAHELKFRLELEKRVADEETTTAQEPQSSAKSDSVVSTSYCERRLRLPVFSIYTFVTWFHAALVPRDFGHPASAPSEWRER